TAVRRPATPGLPRVAGGPGRGGPQHRARLVDGREPAPWRDHSRQRDPRTAHTGGRRRRRGIQRQQRRMSTISGGQVCTRTGVYLLPARGEDGYRVTKDRYVRSGGVNSARENVHVGPLPADVIEDRGRFDTLGRTVYFADSAEVAFAEVLQGFRRTRVAIAPDAEAAGRKGVV